MITLSRGEVAVLIGCTIVGTMAGSFAAASLGWLW